MRRTFMNSNDRNTQHSAPDTMELFINKLKKNMSPPQLVMLVFFTLIIIGTTLLALPYSSSTGRSIGLLDALFTATSAICVNGLVLPEVFFRLLDKSLS